MTQLSLDIIALVALCWVLAAVAAALMIGRALERFDERYAVSPSTLDELNDVLVELGEDPTDVDELLTLAFGRR